MEPRDAAGRRDEHSTRRLIDHAPMPFRDHSAAQPTVHVRLLHQHHHLLASSRHAFCVSLRRDPSLGRQYGARGAGRQVHIPHARNRPQAASKRAVGNSRCCITIRAGELACSLKQLTWVMANWGGSLRSKNPPLGLKFSQVQRTMCSYVVQWRAQAKRVFPTCVRVLPT